MAISTQLSSRQRVIVLTALVFVTVLAVGAVFVKLVEDRRIDDRRRDLSTIGSTMAHSLQRQLDRSLSSTFALATMIRRSDTFIVDSFDSIAANMISSYGDIDSLQLAPGGIVSAIYPLEGNEATIGHNLLEDPARRAEALAAIESRELTIAGPFTLVQGGVAVIGRLPVFVPSETGGDRFWGFTIALIRLRTLLGATDLEQVMEQGHAYELSRVHPDADVRDVFAASAGKEIQDAMTFPIQVPNGTWTLHLAHSDGQGPEWLMIGAGALVTLVVSSRVPGSGVRGRGRGSGTRMGRPGTTPTTVASNGYTDGIRLPP